MVEADEQKLLDLRVAIRSGGRVMRA